MAVSCEIRPTTPARSSLTTEVLRRAVTASVQAGGPAPPVPALLARDPDLAPLVDGVQASIEDDIVFRTRPAVDGVGAEGAVEIVNKDGVVALATVQGALAPLPSIWSLPSRPRYAVLSVATG